MVIAKPPCTTPIGLYRYSPASPRKTALPSSTSAPVMPMVDMIGGGGSCPETTALMNSSPDIPAAKGSEAMGSVQVTVLVREFESVTSSFRTALTRQGFPQIPASKGLPPPPTQR